MKINTISLIIIAELLLMPNLVAAQEEAFIYGRVTTVEGTTYEGPLRWGKEEVFWSDMFNAAKRENKNLKYLSSDEMDYLDEHYEHRDYEWNFRWVSRGWDDREKDYTHQFNCQFGELKSLTP
ncbi:MAG: hypothetical protein KI790_18760, partial [Cyclobacteriaceae bacterium]|nr:hypothetical protein [Cyclobacteriaceae bacterium HetDA_MAG_MS6]